MRASTASDFLLDAARKAVAPKPEVVTSETAPVPSPPAAAVPPAAPPAGQLVESSVDEEKLGACMLFCGDIEMHAAA